FDPVSVRKTAKRLGIRTDSSQRFEKGTDSHAVLDILDEAAGLIAELCQGETALGAIDLHGRPLETKRLTLRPEKTNSLIGLHLSQGEIEELLRRIGCK